MEKVSSDIIGQSDGTTDILVETPHYLVPIIAVVVLCVVIVPNLCNISFLNQPFARKKYYNVS